MWLSRNILSKMVDLSGVSPEEIARRLTMSTAEIEGVEYLNEHLTTVVTARAVDVRPHPDADRLTVVEVDTGSEQHTVVCGAQNHKKGDIVALATVGTRLSEEFTVKKAKIRGVKSSGMLCSERELGLSDDHSGIMILPADTEVGVPLSEIYPERMDVRLEIDNKSITHRPDLWSHRGFARELSALLELPFTDVVDHKLTDEFKEKADLKISIEDPVTAPRYTGLGVSNIRIEESPEWLKAAVTSIGMRPINNIVDITNYVMAELGEPMHAFDRKKLRGGEIIVRMAEKDEFLMTLDEQEFKLMPEDIVIADREGAVALAGVMGGFNSEIEDSTTEIVLEAANFNPVNIRKTAHRYDHRTEAAIRFEKSLSPRLTTDAIIRCYDLIRQVIPGAEASTSIIDAWPVPMEDIRISTSTAFIRKRLGQEIDDRRIIGILRSLDFSVEESDGNLEIGVPHYRATKDVRIPEDIVEEVGRIYGYDNITPRSPFVACIPPEKNLFRLFEREIKDILSADCGMTEVSGYSFVGEETLNRLGVNEEKELRLRNPLSQEQDRLRRSIVPGIIKNISLNQRNFDSFAIYELGRVYIKEDRKSPELISENTRVTGALFRKKSETPIFYEAKQAVSVIADRLRLKDMRLSPADNGLPPFVHPVRAMRVYTGETEAGLIYELHPGTMESFEINGCAALFDIDLDILFKAERSEISFTELQKFPEVPFEISVLADSTLYAEELCDVVRGIKSGNIQSVRVISVYEGEPIPEGMKSVSMKIVLSDPGKTLQPDEIDSLQKKIIKEFNKKGYQLR